MVKLLDTTIRDGSYVIDFQFDKRDVALIVKGLDESNVPFIEIGHGLGLNAGSRQNMISFYSDEDYFKVVAPIVKKSKWGAFFIPGIGRVQDIELSSDYGMDFIRIGTNVTEVSQAREHIEYAKNKGMFVAANFMKTYAVSDEYVAERALEAQEYGADIVYIVDSAGGMFPEDVERYFESIRKVTDIPIGYHGHNNLGLGTANTLKAVELGCEMIDTSIRGMGRSAGNAVTEICAFALKRQGVDLGIDITSVLDIAENVIDPLTSNYRQIDSIGVVSGFAQFHSSYLKKVLRFSREYGVDARELIIKVSDIDRIDPTDDLVSNEARKLKEVGMANSKKLDFSLPADYYIESQDLTKDAKWIAEKAKSFARRKGKSTVLNIVQKYREGNAQLMSSVINDGAQFVIASAEVDNAKDAITITEAINEHFDYFLIDSGSISPNSEEIIGSICERLDAKKILSYVDLDIWAKSVFQLCLYCIRNNPAFKNIFITSNDVLGKFISAKVLGHFNLNLADTATEADIIVVTDAKADFQVLSGEVIIIDAIIGGIKNKSNLDPSTVILRPDMKNVIHSEVFEQISLISSNPGKSANMEIEGVKLVSAGVLAGRGDVVVDNAQMPLKILGVADGNGRLLKGDELSSEMVSSLEKIENLVAQNILSRQSI